MKLEALSIKARVLSESRGSWIAETTIQTPYESFPLEPDSHYLKFGFSPTEAIANVALVIEEAAKSGLFEEDIEKSFEVSQSGRKAT